MCVLSYSLWERKRAAWKWIVNRNVDVVKWLLLLWIVPYRHRTHFHFGFIFFFSFLLISLYVRWKIKSYTRAVGLLCVQIHITCTVCGHTKIYSIQAIVSCCVRNKINIYSKNEIVAFETTLQCKKKKKYNKNFFFCLKSIDQQWVWVWRGKIKRKSNHRLKILKSIVCAIS